MISRLRERMSHFEEEGNQRPGLYEFDSHHQNQAIIGLRRQRTRKWNIKWSRYELCAV